MKKITLFAIALFLSFYCCIVAGMENNVDDLDGEVALFVTPLLLEILEDLQSFSSPPFSEEDDKLLKKFFWFFSPYYEGLNEQIVNALLAKLKNEFSKQFIEAIYRHKIKQADPSTIDLNVVYLKNLFIITQLNNRSDKNTTEHSQKITGHIDTSKNIFKNYLKDNILPAHSFNFYIDEHVFKLSNETTDSPPVSTDFFSNIGQISSLRNTKIKWTNSKGFAPFSLEQFINNLANPENMKNASFEIDIERIPKAIKNLSSLTTLNLSSNSITMVPKHLKKLSHLTELDLSSNYFYNFPTIVWSEMATLKKLNLSKNYLATLPQQEPGLFNLKHLNLSENSLVVIPNSIGSLTNLVELNLSRNQLATLPNKIADLRNYLITFNLTKNYFHEKGDDKTLGKSDIIKSFGDRAVFSKKERVIPTNLLSVANFYEAYEKELLRMDPIKIRGAVLSAIPEINLDAETFFETWESIVKELNFHDDKKSNYLSYEILAQDFIYEKEIAKDHDSMSLDFDNISKNEKNINNKILPRVNGFLRTLFGLALRPGETEGWQMPDQYKQELRKGLLFIVAKLVLTEPITRATIFIQLVNGILYCPTAQKEAVETLVSNLLSTRIIPSHSFSEALQEFVAIEKTKHFREVITPGGLAQNVYVLSLYFEQLKNELGFTSSFSNYKTDEPFHDPYFGSKGEALNIFYGSFTPGFIANKLIKNSQNDDDYILAAELEFLQKEYGKTKNREQKNANLERQQEVKKRIERLARIDHRFRIVDIVNFLKAEGLLEKPRAWQMYFTQNPKKRGNRALLTEEGAYRIFYHAGYIVGTLPAFTVLPFDPIAEEVSDKEEDLPEIHKNSDDEMIDYDPIDSEN